jgi:hypothetical protein
MHSLHPLQGNVPRTRFPDKNFQNFRGGRFGGAQPRLLSYTSAAAGQGCGSSSQPAPARQTSCPSTELKQGAAEPDKSKPRASSCRRPRQLTRVFCAVSAVMAVVANTPSAAQALTSAWMPAPPPLSEPAIASTQGICGKVGQGRRTVGQAQYICCAAVLQKWGASGVFVLKTPSVELSKGARVHL